MVSNLDTCPTKWIENANAIMVIIIINEKNKVIIIRLSIGSYCILVLDVINDISMIRMIIADKYTSKGVNIFSPYIEWIY